MYRYLISICMYCKYWNTGERKPPQSPQNTFSWPRTRGDPLRAPQGMCPTTFWPHPNPPPRPDFSIFSGKISVWTCLATAIETARIIREGQNFAQSPLNAHGTGHNRVCCNQMFIYGLRVHQRCPPPTFLCCGASCHGSRISQDRPGRLKLGPIALPRALYRVHWSVLK